MHRSKLVAVLTTTALTTIGLAACASAPEPREVIEDPEPVASAAPASGNSALVARRINAHAADGAFSKLVDGYLDGLFAAEPLWATWAGIHTHDAALGAFDAASIEAEIARCETTLAAVNAIRPLDLSGLNPHDHRILKHHLEDRIFTLGTLRWWERNPMFYNERIADAIDSLVKRDFAPKAERAKSLVGRLKAVPAALEAARTNLKNPPRIYTEMAIELTRGSLSLFGETIPSYFGDLSDAALTGELTAATEAAKAAIEAHVKWLEADLLPRSSGKFALGAEAYAKKLKLSEMVDTPLDVLLTKGRDQLRQTRTAFIERAQMIDPLYEAREVLDKVSDRRRPTPENLVPTTERLTGDIRTFLESSRLVSLPEEAELKVVPMPSFWWGFAAMDTPGPFETAAKEAYYYVDTPDPSLTGEALVAHMRNFAEPQLTVISMHEVWPGHYLEGLISRKNPSKVRRVLWSYTWSEGWAHYAEEMMIEAGYGKGRSDEEVNELALAHLSEALVRLCRYEVSLRMHTRDMTLDQGIAFFEEQCFLDKEAARREATRGTFDPMYLSYTLGKMQIIELREELKRAQGAKFDLQRFHDRLLMIGPAPLAIHREILLGEVEKP